MMIDTRNAHEAFICKHISNQLLTEGYPPPRSETSDQRGSALLSFNRKIHGQQGIRCLPSQSQINASASQEVSGSSCQKEGLIWH